MGGGRSGAAASPPAGVRAYIAEMIEQMAGMAAAIGDVDLAVALREALDDEAMDLAAPTAGTGA